MAMAAAMPAVVGQDAQDLLTNTPVLNVPTLKQPPKLDGLLDDVAWQQAAKASAFHHFSTGAPSQCDTQAKIGIDRDNLFVAFQCAEAQMGKLALGKLPHDSMELFARDHIELFVMPDVLEGTFYHLSVDVYGNRHDERGSDGTWNGDWQATVSRGAKGWSVELRVPRKSIGMRHTRMALANFCRTRRIAPGETSAWSPTFGIFHNPARFGRLLFGPAGKARIVSASLCQLRLAENRVDVVVADAPAGASIEGYVIESGKARGFGTGAAPTCALPLRVERDCKADIVVALGHNGQVLAFCHAANLSLSGARPTPIRQVLPPDAAPSIRWIDTERLRGISYGVFAGGPMPEDGLQKAKTPAAAKPLHLRGQSHFRIRVDQAEAVRFTLAAEKGDSVFTQAIYAVFDPEGKVVGKGLVDAGTSQDVTVPTQAAGTHVVLVNSGPAMWNPFTITLHNAFWVLDARGKSRYIGTPVASHSLRDCKLAGFNLTLMAAWQWGVYFKTDEGLAKWRAKLEGLCQAAQAADIRLIPYLGWGCSRCDCDSVPEYTRALTRLSMRGPQPCPASRRYWEGSILRPALVIAELSKEYPCLAGVGFDPESYYFGSWYKKHLKSEQDRRRASGIYMPYGGSREKCICNDCLDALLKAKGIADPKLPEDGNVRFDWISKQGLLDELCAHQQTRLEEVVSSVRERVQAVNPDLCFAVLVMSASDTWFCRGVSRGLGTSRMPVLDFDEGTYTPGYSERALNRKLNLYRRWGAHVVHGGTLWMVKHPPANPHFLAAQMFNFALYGHSYWVWPGSMSLWRSADRVRGYYSLSGYAEDYWKSIALANQEISRRLAAPATYRSPLERLDRRPQIPTQPKTQNEWAKKPCYPVHVYAGTRLSFVAPAGAKRVRVRWGYRQALGKQTLAIGFAGHVRNLTAEVQAEQVNTVELDVPTKGGAGWVELLPGERPACVGLKIEGAKPFFGGGDGMALR